MKTSIVPLNSESLLEGSPSCISHPLEISTDAGVLINFETARDGLRRWSGQVKLCSRATIAATTMAGLHLRALRVIYFGPRNANGGRPRRTPSSAKFPDWSSMLKDVAGIPDPTARRWMKIADAVEAIAEKEGSDVRSICQKLPWDWTPEESDIIEIAIEKLTAEKTQRELLQSDFLSSLGYVEPERINSSNNPLGRNGGKITPAATPEARIEGQRTLARTTLFGHDTKEHRPKPGSPAFWMNSVVDLGLSGKLKESPLAALHRKELKDLHDLLFYPFMEQIKSLLDS